MKSIPSLLLLGLCLFAAHPATCGEEGSEDFITLSPFCVDASADSDYQVSQTLAGIRRTRLLLDPNPATPPPDVAVSIFKRTEKIAVQFVLSHDGDKQEVRNRELFASVAAIEAAVADKPGLRMEQREARFSGGNRKFYSLSKGGSLASFATVVIFADLSPEDRIVARVKQVRDLLQATPHIGATKFADGSVGIFVEHAERHRMEILRAIFADLEMVKEGLGPDFEVRPSGLNGRVQARVASETEIEFWINYSFTIHSVRELTRPTRG